MCEEVEPSEGDIDSCDMDDSSAPRRRISSTSLILVNIAVPSPCSPSTSLELFLCASMISLEDSLFPLPFLRLVFSDDEATEWKESNNNAHNNNHRCMVTKLDNSRSPEIHNLSFCM